MGNLLSVSIESAYLDWLTGELGDILLDEIVDVTKDLLKEQLTYVSFAK